LTRTRRLVSIKNRILLDPNKEQLQRCVVESFLVSNNALIAPNIEVMSDGVWNLAWDASAHLGSGICRINDLLHTGDELR